MTMKEATHIDRWLHHQNFEFLSHNICDHVPLSFILDCAIIFILDFFSILHTYFEFIYILEPILKCINTFNLIFTFIKFQRYNSHFCKELFILKLSETIDLLIYIVFSILEDHSSITISFIIFLESIISFAWTIDFSSAAILLEFSFWQLILLSLPLQYLKYFHQYNDLVYYSFIMFK